MITKKLPAFFNVVNSGLATMDLSDSLGLTFQRIILVLGGTTFTKANIKKIRCKLNTKTFYEVTGSILDTINKYKGIADDANHLTIDFTEMLAKREGGELLGGIGTASGVNSFSVEVDIDGATSPTLEAYAMMGAPMPLGPVLALVNHPKNLTSGGKFPVPIPYGEEKGHLVKRVHFIHTGNMTSLEVKKNGLDIFEDIPTSVNEFIQKEYGRVPQANHYCFDPIVQNSMKQAVVTANAKTMTYNVTVSAADNLQIYGEYLADITTL